MSEQALLNFTLKYFQYLVYFVVIVRLFIGTQFIGFVLSRKNRRTAKLFVYTAVIPLIIYLLIRFSDRLNFMNGINTMMLSNFFIHLVFFSSLCLPSIYIIRRKDDLKDIEKKMLIPFFGFIIFYSLFMIILRIAALPGIRINVDTQMLLLGLNTFIFNIGNILFIKRVFKTKPVNSVPGIDISKFKEFSITPREEEIIHLICEGKTNKEIGEQLFITPVTVRDHCSNIYKKTGVRNRTQLSSLFVSSREIADDE